MCCVCNWICKLVSFIASLLFIVGMILLILWLTGVIFVNEEESSTATVVNPKMLASPAYQPLNDVY